MRLDGRDVKRALDARLSALDADPARRARVRERIAKEEQSVKRKMTVSLAFALIAALALTGAALAAAGVNVFEYFAARDARLAPIAQDAAPATQTPLSVASEELGVSSVRFDSAYYDGQNLLVGIAMENTTRMEAYTPTEEELAAMDPLAEGQMPSPLAEGEDMAVIAAFSEAMERGEPCGFQRYTLYPSDHITTGEGADVGPAVGNLAFSEDDVLLELREMETPLPEEIQDLDSLELHMKIWQNASWYWFDGKSLYTRAERAQAGEAVCTVNRSEAEFVTYSGEGSFEGVPVTLSLRLSALHGKLTIEAASDVFPTLSDRGACYTVILLDENGEELRELENGVEPDRIEASCYGLGYLPQKVTAYILIETVGDWDRDMAMREAQPIALTRAE